MIVTKFIALVLAFALAFSMPVVASASNVEYPIGEEYNIEIIPNNSYWVSIWNYNYGAGRSIDYARFGTHLTNSFTSTGYRARVGFYFSSYMDKYAYLIRNSTNVWFSVKMDLSIQSNVTGSGSVQMGYTFNGAYSNYSNTTFNGSVSGEWNISPANLTTLLKNWAEGNTFNPRYDFALPLSSSTAINVDAVVNNATFVFYLQGIDGQDADQFIILSTGLGNIESAVNEVRDEVRVMQGQLDNIEDSINQGFDSVLNPGQEDIDSVNGFKDQISDNKQEASDIKNQLDSVNKPDSGDLNDQVDIDQYIDKEDEGVIAFGSVLSSVFDIDIITKYMLILLSLGLVSLVFFGKKGS